MQGINYLNRTIVVKHVLAYVRKIYHLLIYQIEEMNRVLESTSNAGALGAALVSPSTVAGSAPAPINTQFT
jgi:hypothetical protein